MNDFTKKTMALVVAISMFVPVIPASAMFTGDQLFPNLLDRSERSSIEPMGVFDPIEVNKTGSMDSTMWPTQRNIVRDNAGTVHVVFADNNEIWYTFSKNNGKTWSTAVNISNDTGSFDSETPAIATNGTAVFVTWSDITAAGGDDEYIRFRVTTNDGTNWTPEIDLSATSIYAGTARPFAPSIASNGDRNVYLTWMRNENNAEGRPEDVIYFVRSTNTGSSFGPTITLSTTWAMAWKSTVEADGNNVIVSYEEETDWAGRNDREVFVRLSNNGGQSFAFPTMMMQDGNEDMNPTVMLDGQNITVMWQNVGGSSNIVFRNSTNFGGAWSPPPWQAPYNFFWTGANEGMPTLAHDGDDMYCIWGSDQYNANGDLFMSKRPADGVWTPPVNVTFNNNGNFWPSMKYDYSDGVLEWVWTNNTTSPNSVLYGHMSIPYLNWTGEVGYSADGVQPDSGMTGHVYTFRVKYTDIEDEAPENGYPKILIDMDMSGGFDLPRESFQMIEDNVTDTTYTDGKIYTYDTKFNVLGASKYKVLARDTTGINATGEPTRVRGGPTIINFNEPPTLDWTGEMGFGDDGLDPEIGTPLTNFSYRIRYTDIHNESPAVGFPKLLIDMNDDGDFTDLEDEAHVLDEETGADVTFDNGKIYKKGLFLLPGTYNYMFLAEDVYGFNDSTEIRPGPDVQWVGTRPVLDVTGETGYQADGVDPDSGFDTTEFTFRVRFTDLDNDLPLDGYPLVGIDMDLDGTIEAPERFVMTEDDPTDNDTVDGKIYTHSVVFGALGMSKYEFEAIDANFAGALALNFTGPDVNMVNVLPKLSWLGTVAYDTDGLDPEDGFANITPFTYKVVYEDADDHAPLAGHPKVWIDLDRNGSENASEWFEMEEADTNDVVYSDGKLYSYTTTLVELGLYNYRFEAKDLMDGLATGTPTKMLNGPSVVKSDNLPPSLVFVGDEIYNGTGVSPGSGDLEVDFVYKVKYVDPDDNPPQTGWPKIHIDEEGDGLYTGPLDIISTMDEEDVNDTNMKDGKIYVFTTKLAVLGDTYTYMFKAKDSIGAEATGIGTIHGQVFHGPTVAINERPLMKFAGTAGFENEGVDPDKALAGTEFLFRVIYKDVENDAPLDGKVYLVIDFDRDGKIDLSDIKKEMFEEDQADMNYTDGKEYFTTHTFNTAGTYGYLFEAEDALGNFASGPASTYIKGPIVEEVMPNQPPVLDFTGEVNFKLDGVHPFTGEVGTRFTFRVMYTDVDNDAPIDNSPTLFVNGITLPFFMTELDASDTNYADGKLYTVDVVLEEKGTFSYSFSVSNEQGQDATLGPIDGPVVTKEKKTKPTSPLESQILDDWMWLILIIVAGILCAVIGYSVGKPKRMPPRRPTDEVADVPSFRAETSFEPEPEPAPTPEPEPEPVVHEETSGADLEAGAEQPPETIEEATPPIEETTVEGPPEETKADLESKQDETEAPAEETETDTKGEVSGEVDDDIDDILKKLEDG